MSLVVEYDPQAAPSELKPNALRLIVPGRDVDNIATFLYDNREATIL